VSIESLYQYSPGKDAVTLALNRIPPAFDGLPRFRGFVYSGLGTDISFEHFGRDGFGLCAGVSGIAAQAGAIDTTSSR